MSNLIGIQDHYHFLWAKSMSAYTFNGFDKQKLSKK